MNGKYLLDTNIIIALFASDPAIKEALAKADEVFVPSIAVGKLYFGACKSERVKENLARIDQFTAESVVLGCDSDTAQQYGRVKNSLREKGHPIPENDIWIAAIAFQYGLSLVTRDEHFSKIEDLKTELW